MFKVNGHIHTPYSFSAFSSIEQAVDLAVKEDIKILGINDFNSTDGYDEFFNICTKEKIYPLFNIEFMGLIKEYQSKNIRVNDPNNPGRIYFCGKGLSHPVSLKQQLLDKLEKLRKESNEQSKQMIAKANNYFAEINIPLKLDFDDIKNNYAKELVRERHIAKAIRLQIERLQIKRLQIDKFYKKLYSGKESNADLNNTTALENEIRNNLLKIGGPAFIPEDENAFLNINELKEIIIGAGGISCYPVLLDDSKGNFTDFEKDWDNMHSELSNMNIGCIELIPSRNSFEILEKFVRFFHEKKYVIIFGTEHNTPDLLPLTVGCRNNVPLTDELLNISFEGACVIAAHQYFKSNKLLGYLDENNIPKTQQINKFIDLGRDVIMKYKLFKST